MGLMCPGTSSHRDIKVARGKDIYWWNFISDSKSGSSQCLKMILRDNSLSSYPPRSIYLWNTLPTLWAFIQTSFRLYQSSWLLPFQFQLPSSFSIHWINSTGWYLNDRSVTELLQTFQIHLILLLFVIP